MWVEVNRRVNYPLKQCIIDMIENRLLNMDSPMVKYCVSWISLNVCRVGLDLLIQSWNDHPVPSKFLCTWKLICC